jgi:SHS2 domain-containing protein
VGRHEFLEAIAVADCAVEIEGDDLDDLFATAARALAEVMVDPATVRATTERRLELAAPSLDLLLYDWTRCWPSSRVSSSRSGKRASCPTAHR